MKEKAKAKAYDKVVSKLKGLMAQGVDPLITRADVQDFFPQLQESEDERIRKELISFFTERAKYTEDSTFNGLSSKEIIGWLAKQGESDETKAKTFLINKGYPLDTNGIFPTYEKMYNIIREGLEKQGEQNLLDNVAKQVTKDKETATSFLKSTGIMNENGELADEYKVEQDRQNFIPKFKMDDWVVYNGQTLQIVGIFKDGYATNNSAQGFILKERENSMCLWTIQDAKDGDVIYEKRTASIIIFKSGECGWIDSHCSYWQKMFEHGERHYGRISEMNICPATKEQREKLFEAIHEAGYEWDAENKQLKKIEHTCRLDNSYACVKFPFKAKVKSSGTIVTIHDGQLSSDGKEWIKYQSDVEDKYKIYEPNNLELVCEIEQNLTWSEEDEEIYKKIETAINSYYVPFSRDAEEMSEWFKNLKDRVQPQNHWKPSEEQMKELSIAMCGVDDPLFSLYQDLKKLKE